MQGGIFFLATDRFCLIPHTTLLKRFTLSRASLLNLCSSTNCGYCSCDIIVLAVAIVPSHCNKKQEVIKRAHAKILPHVRV